jgi:hypothetical protein
MQKTKIESAIIYNHISRRAVVKDHHNIPTKTLKAFLVSTIKVILLAHGKNSDISIPAIHGLSNTHQLTVLQIYRSRTGKNIFHVKKLSPRLLKEVQ